MTDTNKQIDEIVQTLAIANTGREHPKLSAVKEAKAKLHDLMVRERIDVLETLKKDYLRVLSPSPSRDFILIGDLNDRIESLEATLNTKENNDGK